LCNNVLYHSGAASNGQPRVGRAADAIAHGTPGPSIRNDCNIDKAARDGNVCDIGDPKIGRSVRNYVLSEVEKMGVVIAIGRCRKTTSFWAAGHAE
jgi:hypothetical protein